MNIAITGIGITSGLGDGTAAHAQKIEAKQHGLKPLSGLLGEDSSFASLKAGWIEDRSIMHSRKWAPASMLSLHVAKQAIQDAGLRQSDLASAAVIVGSSRGNIAGWISSWPKRRPFPLMAASNSMHGELASIISIELGIRGPWQVISSGCAASLDALGMAMMMIKQGLVQRAIVVGVELPLIPDVLEAYQKTGVLAQNDLNDPYSPETKGFFPGEAGAAVVLEAVSEDDFSHTHFTGYWCNSDAHTPIGMPADGSGLRDCLQMAVDALKNEPTIAAICPHASGTLLHGRAELTALQAVIKTSKPISLHPLKPFTGHTVGASGVLDTALLALWMKNGTLPPNLKNSTNFAKPFTMLPSQLSPEGSTVLKIAVGMGGHNSIISLKSPKLT
ncbi:MAG: beta-ketoacyl synthase N-terminal-like domain-containing protein [Akkermansiaceae bacterium]